MTDVQRTRLANLQPSRICVIKPSSLGDVVHAFPFLAALRRHWPEARISWVVNRGLRSLLDGHPDLDEVIPFDRTQVRLHPRGVATVARFLADLRSRRFDLAIDLQGLFRSGVMTAATGASVRVGLASAREGAGIFYNHKVAIESAETHAVDRLLAVAEALGAETATAWSSASVASSADDRAWARRELDRLPSPWLAFNVGARWLTKRWPPEQFAAVARRARDELGAGLILVGAPEDRPLVDALLTSLGTTFPAPLDLCGRTTLPQLAALAAEVDLFLSNDTGPLHLAAAAGAPTLGIYTCTSPTRTGPYGPRSTTVQSCVWCAPSFRKTCPRMDCMTELTPNRVWARRRSPTRRDVHDLRNQASRNSKKLDRGPRTN